MANEAPLKKNRVNLSGNRFMLRLLNITELALLIPFEDWDCDIVRLRGRGAVEPFPLVSSFMFDTQDWGWWLLSVSLEILALWPRSSYWGLRLDTTLSTGQPGALTGHRSWLSPEGWWHKLVTDRYSWSHYPTCNKFQRQPESFIFIVQSKNRMKIRHLPIRLAVVGSPEC